MQQTTSSFSLTRALAAGVFAMSAFVLTACDDGGFTTIPQLEPDAGVPEEEPPAPPVFPLKAGDFLVYPAIGGRIEPCEIGEGACDRAVKATFEVTDVALNEDTNRWEVESNYTYELTSGTIETAAIAQLFVSKVAPFDTLTEGGAEDGSATFVGDAAPTDVLTSNGFPFFHFNQANATEADSAYAIAQNDFVTRIQEIDPEAEFSNQPSQRQLQSYFVDNLGVNPFMHKVVVKYHPYGFVCAWEERMITYTEGMARNESSYAGVPIPIAAIWSDPIRLTRDNIEYRCSCFTATCRDGSGNCLNPLDPDAEPSAENCSL